MKKKYNTGKFMTGKEKKEGEKKDENREGIEGGIKRRKKRGGN